MKFAIIAIVVFALIAVGKTSVIPVVGVVGPGSVAVQASVANGPQAAVNVQTIPNVVAVPAVGVAVAPVVAGQATYVAQNRGVVHVAPLEGHVQSAVSLNLQAPPGTA